MPLPDDRAQSHAKRMRHAPASTEAALWRLLRHRRLEGLKFRRQVAVGRYIADFVCFRHRLVVEADGPLHDEVSDADRDGWLADEGFRVLRIPNRMLTDAPEHVLDAIIAAARGDR